MNKTSTLEKLSMNGQRRSYINQVTGYEIMCDESQALRLREAYRTLGRMLSDQQKNEIERKTEEGRDE